jgi:lipoteichoic acid synthase
MFPALARSPLVLAMLALTLKQVAVVLALGLSPGPLLVLSAAGSSLALLAPSALASGRRQVAAAMALDLLLTAYLWADLLHHRHFGDVTSAASLLFAAQLRDEVGSIARLASAWDLLLLGDLPLVILAARSHPGVALRRVALLALAGLTVAALVAVTDPTRKFQQKGASWPVKRLGPLTFHASDALAVIWHQLGPRRVSAEELDTIRADLRTRGAARPARVGAPPVPAGSNLIVLQVESLQGFVLGARVEGAPVAPNLEALARESLRFDRFYQQTGFGVTSDADYLMNCSQHPLATGSVYATYSDREFHCLPDVLAANGYRTVALQAIRADFWNLAAMYPRVGYQRFYSLKDFVADEVHGHGVVDPSFLRQTVEILDGLPEPFFAFPVTLTTHDPFKLGDPIPLGPYEGTRLGRYLRAIHYGDRAIGAFVAALRERGLLDRSVLVVYGDHHGVARDEALARLLGIAPGDDAGWFDVEKRVPLLVRLPAGVGAGGRAEPGGQVDLAPTLAALLGASARDAPFFGSDLLAGGAPRVIFPDGSALDGARLHLAAPAGREAARCLAVPGGAARPEAECAQLATNAATELARSRAIVIDGLLAELQATSAPPSGRGGAR